MRKSFRRFVYADSRGILLAARRKLARMSALAAIAASSLALLQCGRELPHSAASSKYEPLVEKAWALMSENRYEECYAFCDKEFAMLEAKALEEEKRTDFFPAMTIGYAFHELDGAGNLLRVKQEALKQQKRFADAVPVWERMFKDLTHFQSWRVPERVWHPAKDARIDWVKYHFTQAAVAGKLDSYSLPQDCIFDGVAPEWALNACGKDWLFHGDYQRLEDSYKAMTTLPRWQTTWQSEAPEWLIVGAAKFDPEFGATTDAQWMRIKRKIDQWIKAMPDSHLARVALAEFWIGYAWDARGDGVASEVTSEGWRLFVERLAEARKALDATPRDIPSWYSARLTVCRGQSTPLSETRALAEEGMNKFPWFTPIYRAQLQYLLPRWHGKPGEWQEFAKAVGDKFGAEHYLMVCLNGFYQEGLDSINKGQLDWPLLKQGFEQRLKAAPDDLWIQHEYALFAWAYHDKATGKTLFAKIGNKPHPGVWENYEDEFWSAKAWAEK